MTNQPTQPDLLSPDHLRQTQANHLRNLEAWASKQDTIAGVPVVKCLAYDLIQIVNQTWLSWALQEEQKKEAQQQKEVQS
jgi:hypothetical protein